MQEIIASILDAEKKAEEILKKAVEDAKSVKQAAEEEGEKIKNGAVAVFKVHRAAEIKAAEIKAQEEYDAFVAGGKKSAEAIVEKASAMTDACSTEVVNGITG